MTLSEPSWRQAANAGIKKSKVKRDWARRMQGLAEAWEIQVKIIP